MNTVQPIRDATKIATIKRMLRRSSKRNYLLFVLGINTALRISDLLKLRVKDVLNKDGSVREFLELREQKTHKERRVKLNAGSVEAIEYAVATRDRDAWLFKSTRLDRPIDRMQAYRLIRSWAERVGITERIGAHSLRKTWGYHARRTHGISIEKIQAKLGHRSPAVTRRYIGITADEVEHVENSVIL